MQSPHIMFILLQQKWSSYITMAYYAINVNITLLIALYNYGYAHGCMQLQHTILLCLVQQKWSKLLNLVVVTYCCSENINYYSYSYSLSFNPFWFHQGRIEP